MKRLSMTRFALLLALMPPLLAGALRPAAAVPRPGPGRLPTAYFLVGFPPTRETFVIELREARRIQLARAVIASRGRMQHHVGGIIVKEPRRYNPGWSYHLDPTTVHFFITAPPELHSTPRFIEEHLAEVGVTFLPGSRWLPRNSRLIREIPAAIR
jgi:hypothetical protein